MTCTEEQYLTRHVTDRRVDRALRDKKLCVLIGPGPHHDKPEGCLYVSGINDKNLVEFLRRKGAVIIGNAPSKDSDGASKTAPEEAIVTGTWKPTPTKRGSRGTPGKYADDRACEAVAAAISTALSTTTTTEPITTTTTATTATTASNVNAGATTSGSGGVSSPDLKLAVTTGDARRADSDLSYYRACIRENVPGCLYASLFKYAAWDVRDEESLAKMRNRASAWLALHHDDLGIYQDESLHPALLATICKRALVPTEMENSASAGTFGDPHAMRLIAINNSAVTEMVDITKNVGPAWKWTLGAGAILGGAAMLGGHLKDRTPAIIVGTMVTAATITTGAYVLKRRYWADAAALWRSAWHLPTRR